MTTRLVLGIDEVGTGAWAGPAIVAGVCMPEDWRCGMAKDSKKLKSPAARAHAALILMKEIGEHGFWFHRVLTVDQIDREGLKDTLRAAFVTVAAELECHAKGYDVASKVIDGTVAFVRGWETKAQADALVPVVGAASVLAKWSRDGMMTRLASRHPGWKFDQHQGYGTPLHAAELKARGRMPGVHRASFDF